MCGRCSGFDMEPRHVASVSFGKDSLAMLYLLIARGWPLDEVVFFNNGMEFQAIYDTRDRVLPDLEALGIPYTELYPRSPFLYDMLERPIKYRDKPDHHYGYQWCGGPCRWATAEKVKVIRDYCAGAVIYVGLAADEPQRFDRCGYPNRSLPLAEWGLAEADCLTYCRQLGFQWLEDTENGPVPLYEILDRVSCWCCGNKNLKELKHIYLYLPQYWERLKGLQAHMSRPMKGWYQDGRPKGVFELERRFEQELQEAAKSGRARRAPGKQRGRGPER